MAALPGSAAVTKAIEEINAAYEKVRSLPGLAPFGLSTRLCSPAPPRLCRPAHSVSPLAHPRNLRDPFTTSPRLACPPCQVHLNYENNFWATKMALQGHSSEALSKSKTDYDAWLR